ncbi:hypothetical protein QFC24_005038 [Naganishia onofrii]|uniref:Uncharacterized protein n=1 Tax=Naganishia onofrii TaxID=1851511 RepID=A0ACC2XAU8_9TREE|nr:hypothetical protein QFC24_005038 [Naganishia onofrii]
MFRSPVIRRAVASSPVSAPSSTTTTTITKPTLFTLSKHLRSPVSSANASPSSSAASLSTTTTLHTPSSEGHAYNEPTPPQLPPRRRPQFAAAGFGLGGSHNNHPPPPPAQSTSRSHGKMSAEKGKNGGGKSLNVPVAAVLQPGETMEDHVDGLQEEFNAASRTEQGSSANDAEACYVVRSRPSPISPPIRLPIPRAG